MTEPRSERLEQQHNPSPPQARSSGKQAGGRGGSGGEAGARHEATSRPTPTTTKSRARIAVAPSGATVSADRLAALWLAMSQRIAGRTAHEVKNALNAVAVNLEVVRSRLARAAAVAEGDDATPQPSPAAAAKFADVASTQLEALSALAEAMLTLARAPREPADLQLGLAPLAVVFGAIARSDGGSLRLTGADGGAPIPVAVPAVAVRLALAAALDVAVGRGRAVTCALDGTSTPPRVYLSWLGAVPATDVPADVVAAVGDCGVTIAPDDSTSAAGALTIVFDGAPPAATAAAAAAPTDRPRGDGPPKQDQ